MNYVNRPAALLLFAAVVLGGCAGAPADSGDAAAPKPRGSESTTPPPASPPRPTPSTPAPRQSAPEPNVEGMTIYELQERLAKLGYKPGVVDGVSGPRTVDALKKYQADSKLPVTGLVDTDTIRKLRSEKP
jgi:peptidoglycan hydrolase-like protein with peptidoglycan-binding domain